MSAPGWADEEGVTLLSTWGDKRIQEQLDGIPSRMQKGPFVVFYYFWHVAFHLRTKINGRFCARHTCDPALKASHSDVCPPGPIARRMPRVNVVSCYGRMSVPSLYVRVKRSLRAT